MNIDFSDVVAKVVFLTITSASFFAGCAKVFRFLRKKYKEAKTVTRNYTVTDAMIYKAVGIFSASAIGIFSFCLFIFFYIQGIVISDTIGDGKDIKKLSAIVTRLDSTTVKK